MLVVDAKEEVLDALTAASARIRGFGVSQISLFGSFVRGEQRPDSDVDLLVTFEPNRKSLDDFLGLADFLENLFGRRVEIVTPESLSPYIGPYILAEAEDVPLAD